MSVSMLPSVLTDPFAVWMHRYVVWMHMYVQLMAFSYPLGAKLTSKCHAH